MTVLDRVNDPVRQRFTEHWEFAELDELGHAIRADVEALTLRWTFRHEMRHLLVRAGFEPVAEYSDYAGSPPAYAQGADLGRPPGRVMTVAASAIDVERIERDLRDLVRIPSITGSEEAIQAEMERRFAEIGLATERIETDPVAFAADPDWPGAEMPRTSLPVVVGRLGRPGGRRILLVGHVDVVPPGDPATWTGDPFSGDVRDGRLYGRGACDMKGGVVAILAALRAVAASGVADRFDGEVLAVSVPSEEDGGQGMLAAIRAGIVGDAAVITEPTGLDVVIAHAGALTFRLTVPGRAAHASRPPRGRVGARQPVHAAPRARGRRDRPQRRRDRPADDGARAAVPDDRRQGRGRGVGLDGPRPGRRRGPLRREAGPDVARRGGRPAGAASTRPAPRTRSCATTRSGSS